MHMWWEGSSLHLFCATWWSETSLGRGAKVEQRSKTLCTWISVKVYHIGLEIEGEVPVSPTHNLTAGAAKSPEPLTHTAACLLAGFCCSLTALAYRSTPFRIRLSPDCHTSHIVCKPYACTYVLMEKGQEIWCRGMLSRWNILISGNINTSVHSLGRDSVLSGKDHQLWMLSSS